MNYFLNKKPELITSETNNIENPFTQDSLPQEVRTSRQCLVHHDDLWFVAHYEWYNDDIHGETHYWSTYEIHSEVKNGIEEVTQRDSMLIKAKDGDTWEYIDEVWRKLL